MIPASVFILTKNSAKTLRRALESVKEFADIVICDGGSTDDTLAIVKEFGALVYPQAGECLDPHGRIIDYACARNACVAKTKYDWVVYIDSDEEMSPELREEIRRIVESSNPTHFFWRIPARIVVGEREVKYSSNYPGYQIRFFNKKTGAAFAKAIHERLRFDRARWSVGTLSGTWRYFVPSDPYALYSDFGSYFSVEAKRASTMAFSTRLRLAFLAYFTALKVVVKSLRNYLLHGFRDSMPVSHEWSRIKYQLLLARTFLTCRVPKV